MRRIAVLDAPSNLGLRPPTPTSVPGCAKAPGALRDHGLLPKLAARDAGCLTPPRYDPGDWRPGDGVAHAAEIAAYSRALADRIGAIIDGGEFPVVLGGDCSILIGSGLAMHRLGEAVGGRIGLVFVDGHSDFRHPGNASYVGAAAGEDLALVTGRGQANLAAIESRRPYFRDIDVVVLGIRAQDEYRLDLQAAGIVTRPVPMLRAEGAARSAQWARDQLVDCAGYWVHVDVDVLDPAVMPAVDAPDPGGIAFPELELLLTGLVESPHCLGVEITVFDPDYDPDGRYAAEITSAVVSGLAPVRTVTPRPDLIAARRDLANQPNPAARRMFPAAASAFPAAAPASPAVPETAPVDSGAAPADPETASATPGASPGPTTPPDSAAASFPASAAVADEANPAATIPTDTDTAGSTFTPAPGVDSLDGAAFESASDVDSFDGAAFATTSGTDSPDEAAFSTSSETNSAGPATDAASAISSNDGDAVTFEEAESALAAEDEAGLALAVDDPAVVVEDAADSSFAAEEDADSALAAQNGADPALAVVGDADSAVAVEDEADSAFAVDGDADPALATVDDVDPALAVENDADPAFAVEDEVDPAFAVEGDVDPAIAIVNDIDPGLAIVSDLDPAEAIAKDDFGADRTLAESDEDDSPESAEFDEVESADSAELDAADSAELDAVEAANSAEPETESADLDGVEAASSAEPEVVEDSDSDAVEDAEPAGTDAVEDEPVVAVVSRVPEIRLLSRPLGSAPLLDSEPLPATRPGMLRPRPPADPPAAGANTPHTPQFGKFPPGVA